VATTGERIDGWKSIAGHLRRDRTTVMRWARERDLPVHALPGGKVRTVYALRSELDRWALAMHGGPAEDPPAATAAALPDPPSPAPIPVTPQTVGANASTRARHAPRRALAAAGALALVAAAAAWLLRVPPGPPSPAAADLRAATIYVEARDATAQRTAPGLARAIAILRAAVARDPGAANVWVLLADAWLLAREYGSAADGPAFAAAQQAAERARALDPSLAAAHRALGFIAYWRDGNRAATARAFGRALAADPNGAQTWLWYGNILADNGEVAAAARALAHARAIDPASVPIADAIAWAKWQAGDVGGARHDLAIIVAAAPGYAVSHDCYATTLLVGGDAAGYLREQRIVARLRGEAGLLLGQAMLERAFAARGRAGLLDALGTQALAAGEAGPHPDRSEAAFMAALAGDRARLLELLRAADAAGERWGVAGERRWIAAHWQGDNEVRALLARRTPPQIDGG